MIIIDFAHLSFKSLFVALDKEAFSKNKVDFKKYKGMFIHLMFNYLKLVQTEFSKDYGNDIILALEGSSSWRKEFYPKYKANRVLNENIDWENDIFPTIDEIIEIMTDLFLPVCYNKDLTLEEKIQDMFDNVVMFSTSNIVEIL